MALHSHVDCHEMILVLGGEIQTVLPGRTIRGRKGEVLLYPQGQAHHERSVGDAPLETIFIAWQINGDCPYLFGDCRQEINRDSHRLLSKAPVRGKGGGSAAAPVAAWPPVAFDRQGRMEHLFRWMMEIYPPRDGAEQRMLDSLLHCALYEHLHSSQPGESHLLRRVRSFVRANVSRRLTLDDLAAQASLSKYHFLRLFRSATGRTPMQFVRQARVDAARTLMLTTPLPLKQIARQAGFANEYHLSRVFRQITGLPPGAIRRK
jgi:AraC-like DNA-binding protein